MGGCVPAGLIGQWRDRGGRPWRLRGRCSMTPSPRQGPGRVPAEGRRLDGAAAASTVPVRVQKGTWPQPWPCLGLWDGVAVASERAYFQGTGWPGRVPWHARCTAAGCVGGAQIPSPTYHIPRGDPVLPYRHPFPTTPTRRPLSQSPPPPALPGKTLGGQSSPYRKLQETRDEPSSPPSLSPAGPQHIKELPCPGLPFPLSQVSIFTPLRFIIIYLSSHTPVHQLDLLSTPAISLPLGITNNPNIFPQTTHHTSQQW